MSKPIGTLVRLRQGVAKFEIDPPDLLVVVQGESSWEQVEPTMCTCKCLATGALSLWFPWQLEEAKEQDDE
jgi:hypothetical protein